MPHLGYFLHIEGIPWLASTNSWTPAGDWSAYTFKPVIAGIAPVNYAVDPLERKANVGVLNLQFVDQHGTGDEAGGILTDLFATAKSQERLFLDETIEQGTAMAGAGTIDVQAAIANSTYPVDLYLERETFTATGDDGSKQFTGVTRAAYGSTEARHIGEESVDLYEQYVPRVYLFPASWRGRICKLYRVIDDTLPASAAQVWAGPLLDLTPTGVNTWTLKVGSVMDAIEGKVFLDAGKGELAEAWYAPIDVGGSRGSSDTQDSPPSGPWGQPSLKENLREQHGALTLTADGTTTTAIDTELTAPDDYYNNRHAIHWTGGGNDGDWVPITDWTNATNTLTIRKSDSATATDDTLILHRAYDYTPTTNAFAFLAAVDKEIWAIRHLGGITDGALSLLSAQDRSWTLQDYWACAPGLEGTAERSHAAGAPVKEIYTNWRWPVSPSAITAPHTAQLAVDQFAAAALATSLTEERQHPIKWFLELALSTGLGYNDATYDVLPEGVGLGAESSLIDITGIAAMADKLSYMNYRLGFIEPTNLADLLKNDICVPLGLYPSINSTGQLTLKQLKRHDETSTPDQALTDSDLIGVPDVSYDFVTLVPRITINFDYLPTEDRFISTTQSVAEDVVALHPELKGETIDVHAWVYAGVSERFGPSLDAAAMLGILFEQNLKRVLERLAHQQVIVNVKVPFHDDAGNIVGMDLRPGDTVTLTSSNVIPLPTGTRTLTNEWFEVREVKLDFMNSVASLELYWLGFYNGKWAGWQFSDTVSAWDGPSKTFTLNGEQLPSGSTTEDFFVTASQKIRVHHCGAGHKASGNYGDTEELTVDTVTDGPPITISVTASPAVAPLAGDIIVAADYDSATASQKRYASYAKDGDADISGDETVGAAGDDPYVWSED
jgi:hypothetical protein